MMDRIRETFNDGILEYGHEEDILSDKKKRIGKDFVSSGKLFFKEMYARDADHQMCNSLGATLELKLKTLAPSSFRKKDLTNYVCIVNGQKYEVIKADYDKNYIYFYLTKTGGKHAGDEQDTT